MQSTTSYTLVSTTDRGVNQVDEPIFVLRTELRKFVVAGAPIKVSSGMILGAVIGSYDALIWLLAIAVCDLLLALLPRVHSPEVKRSSIIWSRAMQCAGSYIILGMAYAVQQFFYSAHVNKIEMVIANFIPGALVWTVISSYVLRSFAAFLKLMYGEKAPKVAKNIMRFAPKPVRDYFNDRNLWG